MAGFRHQLLQSVAAWLKLRSADELLLEIEEDFSISSDDGTTNVQVKNSQAAKGPRPYSLQSGEVRSALDRFWAANIGGGRDRRLIFLARGGAAQERDFSFPDGSTGLGYWAAASLGADTLPLRSALLGIMEGTELGRWLASGPNDGELRDRLLRRVQWQLASRSSQELFDDLEMQVREIFHGRRWPLRAARQAVRALMDLAFETASKPSPAERRLTSLDLVKALEDAAVPALLEVEPTAPAPIESAHGVLVTELDFDRPGTAGRATVIEATARCVLGSPLVWIHGTNGVGKSTFARLLARQSPGRWLAIDLRPVQKERGGSLAAWRELVSSISRSGPLDGILIDDFDDEAARGLHSRLIALCLTSGPTGTRLIVTSHNEPPPALLAECGVAPSGVVRAPYFSDEDVEELVRYVDPPEETMVRAWVAMVRVSTGGGHPLLAAARIASLRARGWPREALVEDFIGRPSDVLRISRGEARRSLTKDLAELDQTRSLEAGQLLRRIGCVFDRVDEDLVRTLAQAAPPLPNASDALAVLRGAWLEGLSGGDMRLSPLLVDMVADVPPDEARQWRSLAAEHWIKGRKLDARTLPLCFWNAFIGEHAFVLMMLCTAIQTMRREELRGAAALLSAFAAFKTDQSLLPSNAAVAAQLRLLQFEVASAIEDEAAAGRIARRLFEEIAALRSVSADLAVAMTVPAATAVLMSDFAGITIADRVQITLLFRTAFLAVGLEASDRSGDDDDLLPPKLRGKVDSAGVLFATITRRITGTPDAVELMETLDALAPCDRNRFIDAACAVYEGNDVLVHSGWTRAQLDGGDMAVALADYRKIAEVVSGWKRSDVEMEVICAQAIILDEGLDRKDEAIAILDDAIERYGPNVGLLRQKSKVLGHAGRFEDSARLLLEIEDEVGGESSFGRALALRDGAVSAARAGRMDDASRLWTKAHAQQGEMASRPAWFAAFRIERALVLWRAGRTAEALVETADALDAVETFDPIETRQAERTHQYARALINMFLSERLEDIRAKQDFSFGDASVLEADDQPILGAALNPLPDFWRLLAAVEAQMDLDMGLVERSKAKLAGAVLAGAELIFLEARYRRAMRGADFANAMGCGFALAHLQWAARNVETAGDRPARVSAVDVEGLDAIALGSGFVRSDTVHAVLLDIVLHWQLLRHGQLDVELRELLSSLADRVLGDTECGADFVKVAFGEMLPQPHHQLALLGAHAVSLSPRVVLEDPGTRLYRDMVLIANVVRSSARQTLSAPFLAQMVAGWNYVVDQQAFLLRSPAGAVPALRSKLEGAAGWSVAEAAAFLLEAAPVVGVRLDRGWDGLLASIAEG
ncbi:hypothetical protein [Bosea sp. (in: a-proteobacteria)]|uniref:hypothetical protein n=1 Tax=Bosea sp. (in: a-proteobacteria) TaxID=1871050 RepID=UPI000B09F3E7|nr:hypothetical protein [Bosea sp. (in: a-proteobacteria)]